MAHAAVEAGHRQVLRRELTNLDFRELATAVSAQLVELVEYKRGTPSAKNLSDTFSEDERVIREPQLLRSL